MEYPYGYCGMTCALCSRFRTEGKSRCLGCSNDGYYTDVCKVHHCCRDKGVRHCVVCDVFPCERVEKMGDFRDLDTNHVKERACREIELDGFCNWYVEYRERADMLTVALECFNDGRMKRFMCELFIQNDIEVLREIMRLAKNLDGTQKKKGKQFRVLVNEVLHK